MKGFTISGTVEAPEGALSEARREGEVMPMPVAVFPRVRFETDEAFTTAQELGLDFHREPFGLEEFRKGMDMELVHGRCNLVTDVTHSDPVRTAKLVLAHLRKRPDYYTRLVEYDESCRPGLPEGDGDGWAFDLAIDAGRGVSLTRVELRCREEQEFDVDDAEAAATELGIDFSLEEFDAEDLRRAMNVELEHGCCHPETNITDCDPVLTAKLALAHLRERRDFYEHLIEVEGVLPR